MEDLKPLGLEFIKLGLNDVLYDTKTKEFYTPNTNQHAKMGENPLQTAGKDDIIQGREYIQDPETGLMMGSTPEGGKSKSGMISLSAKVPKRERKRVEHSIMTDFPKLKQGDTKCYEHGNHFYVFSVNSPVNYSFHIRMKIIGNEDKIAELRRGNYGKE